MSFMEWSDSMSVGVAEVDTDHKLLLSLINQLYDSVGDAEEKATLGSVINTLVDYTIYHFSREEKIMEACNYPGLEKHIKIHRALTDQVVDIRDRFITSPDDVIGDDVLDFLKEWLKTHILRQDMEYRPYVEGNDAVAEAAKSVRPMQMIEYDGGGRKREKSFDWTRIKVMIVDDNENFRNISRTILRAARVSQIEEHSNASDALARLEDYCPDVILCDWHMDEMDGMGFMQKLRAGSMGVVCDIPVVMMTGYGADGFEQKARAAGVNEFIEKPIMPRTLLKVVARAVIG